MSLALVLRQAQDEEVREPPSTLVIVGVAVGALAALGLQLHRVERLFLLFTQLPAPLRLCLGSAKFLAIDGGLIFFDLALICLAKFVKVGQIAYEIPPPARFPGRDWTDNAIRQICDAAADVSDSIARHLMSNRC